MIKRFNSINKKSFKDFIENNEDLVYPEGCFVIDNEKGSQILNLTKRYSKGKFYKNPILNEKMAKYLNLKNENFKILLNGYEMLMAFCGGRYKSLRKLKKKMLRQQKLMEEKK